MKRHAFSSLVLWNAFLFFTGVFSILLNDAYALENIPSPSKAQILAECLDQLDNEEICKKANQDIQPKQNDERTIDLSNITFEASTGVPVLESVEDYIALPEVISTAVVKLPETKEEIKSVDIVILFAFDDSQILDSEKEKLDQIAAALKTETLKQQVFTLLGHTDAKGAKDYNCDLAEKRAESVKVALAKRGIAPAQLNTLSAGEYLLKNKNNPQSKENRRVGFIKTTTANAHLLEKIAKLCVF